jgi:hypothetical protein
MVHDEIEVRRHPEGFILLQELPDIGHIRAFFLALIDV